MNRFSLMIGMIVMLAVMISLSSCTRTEWMQAICSGETDSWTAKIAMKMICLGVKAGEEAATDTAEYRGVKDKAAGLAIDSNCPDNRKYWVSKRCLNDAEFDTYYQTLSGAKEHACAKDQYWLPGDGFRTGRCGDYGELKSYLQNANVGVLEAQGDQVQGPKEQAKPEQQCSSTNCFDSCAGNIAVQKSCANNKCAETGSVDCASIGSHVRCVSGECRGECRFDTDCPNAGKGTCEGGNAVKYTCTNDYRCRKNVDNCAEFFGQGFTCKSGNCVKA